MAKYPFMKPIERKKPEEIRKPTVYIEPNEYQPSVAEKEEDMSINASPEEIAAALFQPMKIVRKAGARHLGKKGKHRK